MTEVGSPPIPGAGGERRSFADAAKWSYVMDGGRQLLTTAVTFVLARLLGPEVFGLAAMALAYVLFVQMLQRQGLGAALIQRSDLQPVHLDSAFWATMAVSLGLTALSVGLAGWWAEVNNLPELRNVVIALSAIVPLQGLIIVQEAMLRRAMDFRTLAVRTNASVVVAGLVAIVLAVAGAGVWALVAQQIVSATVGLALLWTVSSWRPAVRFSYKAFSDLLAFSSLSFAATIAVFIGNRSDALLVGLFFGPIAAGLYYFAARLVTITIDLAARALQGAAFPELSRHQHDREATASRMLTILHTSALVSLPLLAALAGLSPEVIALAGDEQWEPAIRVLQILTLVGAVRALTLFTGPLLLAMGRPGRHAQLSWMTAVLSGGAFVAAGISLRDADLVTQVEGLAVSRVLVHVVILFVFLVPVVRLLDLPATALARVVIPASAAGLVGFGAALLFHQFAVSWPLLVRLPTKAAFIAFVLLTALLSFDRRARSMIATVTRRAQSFVSS